MTLFRKKRKKYRDVDPDEILIDAQNLPNFNKQQFEGRLEKAIKEKPFFVFGFLVTTVFLIFSVRLFYVQIIKGDEYLAKSERNSLNTIPIFADRGIIYDKNKIELAWNERLIPEQPFADRIYIKQPGFAHLLGYIKYPEKDNSGNFWRDSFIAKDGVEKVYSKLLEGKNGVKIFEEDVYGNIYSENTINPPIHGSDLVLSVDSRVQEGLYKGIETLAQSSGYRGGGGVIIDVHSGDVLAMTSYPEYDPNILSKGEDKNTIKSYLEDSRRVFINRVLSGVYTPGSIVKPFVAIGALNERIIDPLTQILSTGKLIIPNIYGGPDSVFKDWRAQGYVDMREAISVSSNIYFYEIGGGYKDQKGLGIVNIEKYAKAFGIGQKTGIDLPNELTGVIPNIEWKKKNFPNDPWRIGDTYHTSIGQYGFQVTPIQMARATAALVNGGNLVTPGLVMNTDRPKEPITIIKNTNYYKVIQEGMRQVVTSGTGTSMKAFSVAAKSGTAQVGVTKNRVNSWVIGFFPYENPKYAFAILMESGAANQVASASNAMKYTLEWMQMNTPEYLK